MDSGSIVRLLTLAALWGGSFAFIRVAVPALGPAWLAWARVALAFIALFAVALARRDLPSLSAHWRGYLILGAVNSALPFALYAFAEQYVTASTAAILNATSPFFGALGGAIWLGEPLGARRLAGMGLGLAGVVLLVGWQPEPWTVGLLAGIFACLGAALCYGAGGVYAKARMASAPSFAIALYSLLAATIVLAPGLAFTPLPATPTPLVAANVLALALAATAVAYLIYFRLIRDVGPSRALTVTFLIPPFGLLWGVAFLDEKLTANTLSGCALILAGTWFALRSSPPASDSPRGAPQRRNVASR